MNKIIHILGSDIPHHNMTVLRFFNDTLTNICLPIQTRYFMVVAKDKIQFLHFNQLYIEFFKNQLALTKALVCRAVIVSNEHYFLHGQFNTSLWLAIITKKIKSSRLHWHVWGADLYENPSRYHMFYWFFYMLRRRAQGYFNHVFATYGDLIHYKRHHPLISSSLLYFPTRLATSIVKETFDNKDHQFLTILVGNSGDASNRHIKALKDIQYQFGSEVRIIIPMGYPTNNNNYIAMVRSHAKRYFPNRQVSIFTEKLVFDDYTKLIRQCDIGYFLFKRQQGIGTLSLMIQFGLPFVLSRDNPFCYDLLAQRVPILYEDELLSKDTIYKTKQDMRALDLKHMPFFYPKILQGWCQALSITAGI